MKRCLMMILLIALLMPMIYATPQEPPKAPTQEELLSAIDLSLYYPGSAVREFVKKIFLITDDEIILAYQQGAVYGAATAAVPLLIRIDGLKAWQDEAKKELSKGFWDTMLWVGGGIVAGFIVGVVVK